MRQKRAKAYRKLMHLYCMSFGFRQPYQVLVDSEMCRAAVSHKLELAKQLNTVLQGEVKPMITQCCIHELYLEGKTQQAAVDIAKAFERRMCNHRLAIPGDECLQSVIGDTNKHRYVVATQSQPLRVKLRAIPATPLVHVNRSVMVLEPPSDMTLRSKALTEEQSLHATAEPDIALVGTSTSSEPPRPKKKGPKGPNPLSVKKKQKPAEQTLRPSTKSKKLATNAGQDNAAGKKRKAEAEDGSSDDDTNAPAISVEAPESSTRKRRKRRKTLQANTSSLHKNTAIINE